MASSASSPLLPPAPAQLPLRTEGSEGIRMGTDRATAAIAAASGTGRTADWPPRRASYSCPHHLGAPRGGRSRARAAVREGHCGGGGHPTRPGVQPSQLPTALRLAIPASARAAPTRAAQYSNNQSSGIELFNLPSGISTRNAETNPQSTATQASGSKDTQRAASQQERNEEQKEKKEKKN
ncbi:hypothetical protein BS78_08G133300 [Paspalum vaginatum]|nr:hypothetical protein BS78_08G133300 [Paspalum vaginatum]